MSEKSASESRQPTHPDFDGHLDRPIEDMTDEERFVWAWRGMQLLHWSRQHVHLKPADKPGSPSGPM